MRNALDAARDRFLERPEQGGRRQDLLQACLESGDLDLFFSTVAEALEAGSVTGDAVGSFGSWLVEAIGQVAEHAGGEAGAQAAIRAASMAMEDLGVPAEASRLAERAWALDGRSTLARRALEILGEAVPAPERLCWIERAHSGAGEPAEQAALALSAVRAAQEMGNLGKARLWAARAAEAEPAHADLLDTLDRQVEEQLDAIQAQERQARARRSRRERAKGLAEVARALLDLDPEGDRPLEIAREALDLYPEDPDLIRLVAELHAAREEISAVEDLYRVLLDRTERRQLRLLAHRELASLYRGPLDDPELAQEHLAKILDIEPGDEEAFQAIAAVLRRTGDHDGLVELYQAAVRQHPPKQRAVSLLTELGELLWGELDELDRAEEAFRRLRSLDPRNLQALEFFIRLYEHREDWRRLYATLSQRLGLESGDQARSRLARRMARLAAEHLGDKERALESYKRALRYDAGDRETQEAIRALYEETGKWHALVDFLNGRIQAVEAARREGKGATAPAAETERVDAEIALLFQLIEIYQDPKKIPSEDMVIKTYRRIVDLSPTHVEALDSLARRYEDRKRWRDLIQVLQRRIEVTEDAEDLLGLFHQVAALWIDRMANASQAIPFLERILELDPENLEVVRKLRDIYRAKHNVEKLYSVYERELELETDPESRRNTLVELASLAQTRLHEPERAAGYWRKVLEIDPEHGQALSALWSVYAQRGRWDDMLGLCDALLARGDLSRKRRIEFLERKGRILSERIADHDGAREVYAEILRIAPANSFARNALQQIYVRSRDWTALEALFQEREDWFGYIQLLDDQDRRTDDELLKADINREVARVFETHLGDTAKAAERMAHVLQLRPDDLGAARWLLEHADEAGRLADRVDLVDRILGLSNDPHERGRLLELGTELAVGRGDPEAALGYATDRIVLVAQEYGSPLDLEPLVDLVARSRRAEGLVDALDQAGPLLADDGPRGEYRRSAARLVAEYVADVEEAVARWQSILAEHSEDAEALNALERLLRGARRWDELETVLRRKEELSGGDARLALLRQLATLYEDVLDTPGAALEVLRDAEALEPDDPEIRMSIRRILRSEERFEELSALLESDASRAEGAERSRILLDLLDIRLGPLQQSEAALGLIRRLIDEAPDFEEPVVRRLVKLVEDGAVGLDAARLLRKVREASGTAAELTEVLDRLRALEPEPEDRREATLALSQAYERRLDDAVTAFDLHAEILEDVGPDPELLDGLERLAGFEDEGPAARPELGDRYVDLVRDLAGRSLPEPALTAAIRHRLARRLRLRPDGLAEAAEVLEQILYDDPEDLAAAAALEEVLTILGEPEALLRFYQGRVDVAFEPAEKIDLYLKICGLLRSDLGREEESIDYYRSILLLDETHAGAVATLEELYRVHGRWEDLMGLLRRRIDSARNDRERAGFHFEIGIIARDQVEDHLLAVEELRAALAADGGMEEVVDVLEQMLRLTELDDYPAIARQVIDVLMPRHQESGNWDKVVYLHAIEAELEADPARKAERYARIGQVWQDRIGDRGMACQAYLRALELDPGQSELAHLARTAALEVGEVASYVELMERLLDEGVFPVATEVHLELAGLLDRHLDDPDRALPHYEAVAEAEPYHPDALRALDRLYGLKQRQEERLPVLERLAEVAPDAEDRVEVTWRLARVALETGDRDRAEDALRYVSGHPDAATPERIRDALLALADLQHEEERFDDERTTLDRLIELTGDPAARGPLLERATDAAERAGDLSGAIARQRQRVEIEPARPEPWKELGRLLREEGDLEALAGILRSSIDALARGPAREEAVIELVDLLRGPLGRGQEVLDLVAPLLEGEEVREELIDALLTRSEDPQLAVPLSTALAAHFARAGEASREAALWEHLLDEHADELHPRGLHRRLADLYGGPLGDPAGVVRHAVALLALDPEDGDALIALHGALDTDPELLEEADTRMERVAELSSAEVRAACRRMLAEAARQRADAPRAVAILRRLIEELPADIDAITALESLLETAEDWIGLAEILRQHGEVSADAGEQQALWMRLAEVLRQGLGDRDGAEDVLRTVLAAEPEHRDAFEELRDLLVARADPAPLAELLEARLEVAEPSERVEIRMQLVRIVADDLGTPAEAQHQAALLLDSAAGHAEARACVLGLYEGFAEGRAALAEGLRAACVEAGEPAEADRVLDLLLDVQEEPEERARTLAAQVALRRDLLEDSAAALVSATALIRLLPHDLDAAEEVLRLAGGLGEEAQDQAIGLLSEIAHEAQLDDDARGRLADLAAGAAGRRGRIDQSLELYRLACEAAPADRAIADRMLDLCRAHDLHEERVRLLLDLAEAAVDPERRVALLREAAETRMTALGDPEVAAAIFESLLEEAPADRDALRTLEAIRVEARSWEVLVDLYEHWLGVASDPGESVRVRWSLAEVLAGPLARKPEAMDQMESILVERPDHPETLAMLQDWLGALAEVDAPLRARAVDVLELQARFGEVPEERALLLRTKADLAEDPLDRAGYLEELARTLEPAEPDLAFDALLRALEADSERRGLLAHADRMARSIDRVGELVEALLALAGAKGDLAEVPAFQRTLGDLLWSLDRRGEAGRWFERYVGAQPEDTEVQDRLELVLREEGDAARLAAYLAQRAERTSDSELRVERLLELARLRRDDLEDPEGAREAFQRAREVVPSSREVFDGLELVLEALEDHEALEDLYRAELHRSAAAGAGAEEEEWQVDLRMRLAAVLEKSLDRPDEAAGLYEDALRLRPGNLYAVMALERIYADTERWEDLVRTLESKLGVLQSERDRSQVHLRMGIVLWEKLEQADEAVARLGLVLQREPGNAEAVSALEHILEDGGPVMQIAVVLEPIYDREGRSDQLMELLRRQIEEVYDLQVRVDVRLRLAELLVGPGADAEEAIRQLALAAAEHEGPEPVLNRAVEAAREAGLLAVAVERLREAAEGAPRPEVSPLLLERAAKILEVDLGEPRQAAEILEEVRSAHPGRRETLAWLAAIYRGLDDAESLLDVIRAQETAAAVEANAPRTDLMVDRARLLAESLDDRSQAASVLREALWEQPDHEGAIALLEDLAGDPEVFPVAREVLEPIWRERGDHDRLVQLYLRGASNDDSPSVRGELLRGAGELTLEQKNAPSEALGYLLASLDADPDQSALLSRALSLAGELSAWERARATLEALLERGLSAADETAVREALAGHAASLEDVDLEDAQLRAILDLRPDRADIVDRRIELFRAANRPDDLIDACRQKLDLAATAEERAEVLRAVATVEQERGRPEASEQTWKELLDTLPDDDGALTALEAIYRDRGAAGALVEVLRRQAELIRRNAAAFAEIMGEIGAIRDRDLDDPEGAVADLEEALLAQTSRDDLAEHLEALYRRLEMWPELHRLMERRLDVVDGPEERLDILVRLGMVAWKRLEQPGAAIGHFEKALEIRRDQAEAANALYALYRETGRHEALLELHRSRLGGAESDTERVAILTQIVRTRMDQGERGQALAAELGEILELDPTSALALRLLADLRAESGEPEAAHQLYMRCLDLVSSAEEAVDVQRRLGRLCDGPLERPEEAERCWQAVVDAEPGDEEAHEVLDRLLGARSAHEARVALLASRLEREGRLEQRAALMAKIAEIHLDDLEDGRGFLRWVQDAQELLPHDPRIVTLLIRYHESRGELEDLVPLLSWYVNHLESRREYKLAADHAHRLARLYLRVEDWEQAAVYARMATKYDAENVEPMLTYAEILEHDAEWDLARNVYQGILMLEGQIKGSGLRAEILFRMARVCHELRDAARTRQYVERCLMLDPEHQGARVLAESLN